MISDKVDQYTTKEDHYHEIGKAGRMGNKGV